MTQTADNSFARALSALHEVQAHQDLLLNVARPALALGKQARHIDALNDPLFGLRQPNRIKKATEAMESAEPDLAQTLDRVPATLLLPISPTSETLTVADRRRRYAEDKDEDRELRTADNQRAFQRAGQGQMSDQDETPPPKRLNLRMKFGAEMNDPPPPPPEPLQPPEEPANTDRKPEKKP